MSKYARNTQKQDRPVWPTRFEVVFDTEDILRVHRSLAEYRPTPLMWLPSLSARLGVGRIAVKDESQRFGLKAFKALGASYAIHKYLQDVGIRAIDTPGRFTFCTATDGNHGRGVAWVARKLRQHAVVFVPRGTAASRVHSIESEGAEVVVVDGDYDDAVETAACEAAAHGWTVISDTSWAGYERIPRWIQAGYRTLFEEVHSELPLGAVDVVIVPGGVGALAAAAGWYYARSDEGRRVKLVCVEPEAADCLLQSASAGGSLQPASGALNSVMAGLNCGTVSPVAWPFIRDRFDLFVAIPDRWAIRAMRTYYRPSGTDPVVVSGESGAASLGALLALLEDPDLMSAKEILELGERATVLVLNTEGDTDPANFARVQED